MRIYDIIEKKRDGKELSYEEISFFINGYLNDSIPDYQASALLMAIFIRGMNGRETADLTLIMANSGDKVDLSPIPGIKIDKHSTGGVGDKTTLIVAPIVASCNVPVAKMSGRGLSHTGGTIDKLESIPSFRTSLSNQEFISNVKKIGLAISGQTGNLAPSDKKLYALRDVTATVNNISLIASSIMSKKIASGADKIVLDVKTGSGAFMKTLDEAIELSRAMVEIGKMVNKTTVAIITDMDVPLGNAIGNSLEIIEAIETLKGNGPNDLFEVCIELSSKMLELGGLGNHEHCVKLAKDAVANKSALNKFIEMIKIQGGNSEVVDNYALFGKTQYEYQYISDTDGYIESIKTDLLGISSMVLGAGRAKKEDAIDLSAGIILNKKTGNKVKKGDIIATLYTNKKDKIDQAIDIIKNAFVYSNKAPVLKPLILSYVS